jgi:hypothetical protein
VRDQVSHQYKTTGKITVLYILMFTFLRPTAHSIRALTWNHRSVRDSELNCQSALLTRRNNHHLELRKLTLYKCSNCFSKFPHCASIPPSCYATSPRKVARGGARCTRALPVSCLLLAASGCREGVPAP